MFSQNSEYRSNLDRLRRINNQFVKGDIESFEIILPFRKYNNFERFMKEVIKNIWSLSNQHIENICRHELAHYRTAKKAKFTAHYRITIQRRIIDRRENKAESSMTPSVHVHVKDIKDLNQKQLGHYLDIALAPDVPSESDLTLAEDILNRIN